MSSSDPVGPKNAPASDCPSPVSTRRPRTRKYWSTPLPAASPWICCTPSGPRHWPATLLIDVGVGLSDDFSALTHPNSSLGELIQEAFPLTPVVKTLCTMDSTTMTAPGELTEPGTVFLSGDDAEAKRTTGRLLTDLGWPESSQLDIGGITTARGQEHFAFLFMGIAGGVASHTFNIKVVTRPSADTL